MPTYALTINATGGTRGPGVLLTTVLDFTGANFSNSDATNQTLQTASTIAAQTTGSITTTANGDVVVGGFISGGVGTPTAGSGWTLGYVNNAESADEYQVQTSGGAINPVFAGMQTGSAGAGCGVTGSWSKSGGTYSFSQKIDAATGSATSVTATLAAQPAVGDLIVVLAYTLGWSTQNTGFSVTADSFGNSYTQLGTGNFYNAGQSAAAIFYLGSFKTSSGSHELCLMGCGT
jgi:hypothetical protein